MLIALQRFAPSLPAALIVVAASIAASRAFDLAGKGVAVVNNLPSSLPTPALPHVGFNNLTVVLGGGLALAFISYAESIGAARSMARRNGYEVDANQELIALGGGNVLAGFLQGFPTDASLSRTAVADASKVRSPLFGVVVFVMLIVTIVWLTPFFDGLPQATLAAVIIGSIYRLIDVAGFRHLWRIDPRGDFVLAAVAVVGVLVFGALGGIATAVIASLVALIAKLYRPKVTTLGRAPGGEADEDFRFRDIERHPECETFPGLVIVRFGGELFFANATYLRRAVTQAGGGRRSTRPRGDSRCLCDPAARHDRRRRGRRSRRRARRRQCPARPRAGEPPAAHRSAPLRPRGGTRHLRRVARRRGSGVPRPGTLGRIIQKR